MSALVRREALIEGSFRYWLLRDWSGRPVQVGYGPLKFGVLWVMLNPSVADERRDDPTIRKCVGFTKRMGLDSFVVVNLYAFRATDPGELRTASARGQDIVGPRNDETIKALAGQASVIICAWGAFDGVNVKTRVWQLRHMLPEWRACRVCQGTMSVPVEGGGKACPACLEHQGNEQACSALAFTKAGQPRHPLMMPYYAATELKPWPPQSRSFSQYIPRKAAQS